MRPSSYAARSLLQNQNVIDVCERADENENGPSKASLVWEASVVMADGLFLDTLGASVFVILPGFHARAPPSPDL